jgi:hypothetical protein
MAGATASWQHPVPTLAIPRIIGSERMEPAAPGQPRFNALAGRAKASIGTGSLGGDVPAIQSAWTEAPGPSDVASRYVNSAEIAFSQWDMTVDFQLATPVKAAPDAESPFLVQRVARIVMSPTHAKVLAEMIHNAVGEWETRFGALPDVESLTRRPDAAAGNEAGAQK